VDHRADLYALGATLYHMVTGQVPYEGSNAAVVMAQHLNEPIPDAREHTPDLSSRTVAIIRHAMAKDRDKRYQTATEMREDIEAALAGRPLPHATKAPAAAKGGRAQRLAERRARAAAKKRKGMIVGGIAAGAVVLAVILVLALSGGEKEPQAAVQPSPTGRPRRTAPPKRKAPSPRPKPRPKPTKKKPTPPKADPNAVLQELLAWEKTTADRQRIDDRFTDFVLRYPGTAASKKAKAHLAELKARWKALDALAKTVRGHVEGGEFKAALDLLDEPAGIGKSEEAAAAVRELRQEAKLAAAQHIEAQDKKGQRLIRDGKFDDARTLYQDLAALGLPEATKASQAAQAQIEKRAAERQTRLARRAFAERVVACAPLVQQGKLDAARQRLDPAKAEGNEDLARLLEAGQGDIEQIAKLFGAVEKEIQGIAKAGGSVRVRGIKQPVVKVENGTVHCRIGGRTDSFGIHELTLRDLAELKSIQGHPKLMALWQLYRGDVEDAKSALEKQAEEGGGEDVTRWLAQIEWIGSIGREGEAKDLLAKARENVQGNDWGAAQQHVKRLRGDYRDTAFVEQHLAEIAELQDTCLRELAAERRKAETIRPFIDVTERAGDIGAALAKLRASGGWVMDLDNDGRLDIALDLRDKDKPHVPVFLNRSRAGTLRFVEATRLAGLATGEEPICWVDLDGDGDLDVVCRGLWHEGAGKRVSDHKKLGLYENRGPKADPMFRLHPDRAIAAELGQAPGFGGYGFGNIAVLDANGDGRSDILAQFVSTQRTLSLFLAVPGKPFVFEDVSAEAGFVRKQGGKIVTSPALQVKAWPNYVVFDYNGDNRADFIFNTDGGMLFRNQAGRTFVHVSDSAVKYDTAASARTGNNPRVVPAVADYDNDGDIDILVPQNGKNLLLRNEGGRFADAMHTTGPMATDAADSLWATWADVNNDGLLDLFVCNAGERNRLYIQKANHAFVDKAEEFGVAGRRDAATNFVAFGDLDRDGDQDMLVLRAQGRNQLLMNPYIQDDNHYALNVILRPPLGTIGAKVYLMTPDGKTIGLQQVCRVEGYNRQTPREAFFGVPAPGEYAVRAVLGPKRRIDKRVTINPAKPNILFIGK
jgi:hypothetical protein